LKPGTGLDAAAIGGRERSEVCHGM